MTLLMLRSISNVARAAVTWAGILAGSGRGGAQVIGEILPEVVACAEAFGDAPDDELFPAEEALLARAVQTRRSEFATGRRCARNALGALGLAPVPILPGQAGAPQWPSGIVGSITHCAGYRAAAVAQTSEVMTIGLDAEPAQWLPGDVLELVALPGERARLRDLAAEAPGTCWDRLLFSAKESVYKAWFPLAHRWLGFADADITINAADGTFDARLLVVAPECSGVPAAGFSGRWLAREGMILTAITVLA
jgi:4'-phosphopantetheinyl transferase EntD